jgi:hypothetical protein
MTEFPPEWLAWVIFGVVSISLAVIVMKGLSNGR